MHPPLLFDLADLPLAADGARLLYGPIIALMVGLSGWAVASLFGRPRRRWPARPLPIAANDNGWMRPLPYLP